MARDLPEQITGPVALKLMFLLVLLGAWGFFAFRVALPLKTAYLYGNKLVVGNFLTKIEIPLQNIELVDGPDATSWMRVTIHLDYKSRFGDRLVIVPGPLWATNVANYLRESVDKLT